MSIRLFWFAAGFLAAGIFALALHKNDKEPPSLLTPSIPIVQGGGEFSPFEQRWIQTRGILTFIEASSNGVKRFFLQDQDQAIYCYLPKRLDLNIEVGQWVTVEGFVKEYSHEDGFFTNTEITILQEEQVTPGPTGELPEPHVLDLSQMAQLSPSQAMEAYEPYESLLVKVQNPRVLDLFNDWESRRTLVAVIPDDISTDDRNSIGTLTATATENPNRNWNSRYQFDFNAERLFIDHVGSSKITEVGTLLDDVVGVLDLSRGQPIILPTTDLRIRAQAQHKTAKLELGAQSDRMMIATYNLWNLSARDTSRISKIAQQLVGDLHSPDLVALAEVQDDSGIENSIADRTTTSRELGAKLTQALADAGVEYRYLDRAPDRHREGGIPGGNIRVGFLYRPDRIRPIAEPFRIPSESRPVLEHLAFEGTRKALGCEFEFLATNRPFFAVATHLKSKRGDDSVWKKSPRFESETQRIQQCLTLVNAVEAMRSQSPNHPVIMMGDFNDYAKSKSLRVLTESGLLDNVLDSLPPKEQFTYRYRGNVSTLDHILVSPDLAKSAKCQILHLNTVALDRNQIASDHDPIVASVSMN
tara:strand:- start:14911 stop:16668 length:1758 start_codon:yes stop_codon:yes gene_type:complete